MFLLFTLSNIIFGTTQGIEVKIGEVVFGLVEQRKIFEIDLKKVQAFIDDLTHLITENADLQSQCDKLEDGIKKIENEEEKAKTEQKKFMKQINAKLHKCERRLRKYREKRDGSKVTLSMVQEGLHKTIGNGCKYMFYDKKCEKYDAEIQKLKDEKYKQMDQYQKSLTLLSAEKCGFIEEKNEIKVLILSNNAKKEDEISNLIVMLMKYKSNGNEEDFELICRDKLVSIQ